MVSCLIKLVGGRNVGFSMWVTKEEGAESATIVLGRSLSHGRRRGSVSTSRILGMSQASAVSYGM